MSGMKMTDEQRAIIKNFGGYQFVSAGAGSGKTMVVIEGIVTALEQGKATVDQVLAITYTEKAAGQMVRRARMRLQEKGMMDEHRQIERARISTIHGFCSTLIRGHAFFLGLDQRFSVADEARSSLMKEEAFSHCLERFVKQHGDQAVSLLHDYDPNRTGKLAGIIISVYDELRSRGEPEPDLGLDRISAAAITQEFRDVLNEALKTFDEEGSSAVKSVQEPMLELLEALDEPDAVKRLKIVSEIKLHKKAIKDMVARVLEARRAYLGVLLMDKLELLRQLLVDFGQEYAMAKRAAGTLDFEDLQLEALRLLEEHEDIRRRVAESFELIVVDEFQDTNGLQYKIVDLLARDNVCFVGDENQSIYRFRHADVDLFRQKRRQAAASVRPLSRNFRSQGEILAFVDYVFDRPGMLASDYYLKMTAGAERDDNGDDTRVEVILVDGSSFTSDKAGMETTRSAEAELVARRLKQLFESGLGYAAGDAVILVRNKTEADKFSDALDRLNIPSYLSIGTGYYGKLELGDAMSLLRLLVNPLDDVSLLGVLRSPMVSISDDAFLILRRIAGSGNRQAGPPPLWPTILAGDWEGKLPAEQGERLRGFIDGYQSLRRSSGRQTLEATVRDVISYRDYAAIAAAGPDGRKAYANLLKLVDLAMAFEDTRGRDLPSFVDFLMHQRDAEVKEGEAPTEEESSGSVQIMTIHSAKGLEFPVVVWGFMGTGGKNTSDALLLGEEGSIGFRYPPLKQRSSDVDKLLDYQKIEVVEKRKNLEDEKRLGYVAMTRAERHLILCGTTDINKKSGGAYSNKAFEWVKDALNLDFENPDLGDLFAEPTRASSKVLRDVEGCPVSLTVCTDPAGLLEEIEREEAAEAGLEVGAVNPDIDRLPVPARYVPSYVSSSALSVYKKCPYRFYLEQQLKMTRPEAGMVAPPATKDQLPANQMGSLVHKVLEEAELSPEIHIDTSNAYLDDVASRELGAGVSLTGADYQRAARLLENFKLAPVAGELADAEASGVLYREQRFTTLLDATMMGGFIDVLCRREDRMLVVDYKTDRIEDESELETAAAHHAPQMAAYALAASRLDAGGAVEVVLVFLDSPGAQVSRKYSAADIDGLSQELRDLLASMGSGRFPPLSAIDTGFCPGCTGFAGDYPLCPTAINQ